MNHRALVGADGVGPGLQRRANVVGRRLPGHSVQRAHFEHRVSLAQPQPFADVCRLLRFAEIVRQQPLRSEPLRRNQPPQPPRSHASHAASEAIALAEFRVFSLEECDKGLADIAQPDEAEVAGADADLSRKTRWPHLLIVIAFRPRRSGPELSPEIRTRPPAPCIHLSGACPRLSAWDKTLTIGAAVLSYNSEFD